MGDLMGREARGITRREALRQGTLFGAGAVWATPALSSITMSANLAAATSPTIPPPDDNTPPPPDDNSPPPDTNNPPPDTNNPPPDTNNPLPDTNNPPPDTGKPPTEVEGDEVTTSTTAPTSVGGISVTQPNPSQVQAGGELPLTGLEVADTAILGAGLLAAGAALLKATEPDKGQRQS
ncbi:MAG TPA: hypothetical protein VJR05_07865 [Acidimicrobiia bacterium]|nr:hypothetical protein [Acidimicrobiia bacterium]